jgi:signal transduction histidine kinase
VRTLVKTDPAAADRSLEQTRDGINATIRDVRAYIVGLAPENLRRAGFAQALDALLLELQAGRAARVEVTIDDAAAALLTPEQRLQALQIAREAVSNALRHGAASHLAVRLHRGDREIGLLVQDDGCGFDAAARREGGHGVGNMRARADLVGAQLRLESGPGAGTRVVATFPIPTPPPV